MLAIIICEIVRYKLSRIIITRKQIYRAYTGFCDMHVSAQGKFIFTLKPIKHFVFPLKAVENNSQV